MIEGQTVYVRDPLHRHYTKWGMAVPEVKAAEHMEATDILLDRRFA